MTLWLLDKSAHVRLVGGAPPYDSQAAALRYPVPAAPADIFDRVRRLQRNLTHHRGMWHRTPLRDLFIAETALHHGAGFLHHDRDYRPIGAVRCVPICRCASSTEVCHKARPALRTAIAAGARNGKVAGYDSMNEMWAGTP